jgi:HlyD family secretion protein
MLKTKKLPRLGILAILIALISIVTWFITRPDPIEVDLATAEMGLVESTVVNTRAGTIKACRRAKLAPAAGGHIVKLLVKEGDRVEEGQHLLELWNDDLSAQRDLVRRQLTMAEERRTEVCTVAVNARRESERTRQLADQGFVSAQRSETVEAEARSREASCEATKSDIKRAQAQIKVTQAGIERTILLAPFAGIVARITGELGEYATPSPPGIPTPPAIDLIDDTCLYVSAPMDEVDAPKLRVGQTARVTLDAIPGQIFLGRVRRIAPYVTEIEKQARTVDIEVDFDEPPKLPLLVGYSADVESVVDRRDDILRIPTQSIRQGGRVLIMDANQRLQERTVQTGLANWAYTEITGGLTVGEKVLLSSDQDGLVVGAKVKQKTSP